MTMKRTPTPVAASSSEGCVDHARDARIALPAARQDEGDEELAEHREDERRASESGENVHHSTNSGFTNSSNVVRSQLATVAGVRARTVAVRGMSIASATSPK